MQARRPEPPAEPARAAVPPCRLSMRGDRLCLERPGDPEPLPVQIVYLQPLSDRRSVAFLDDDGREVLQLDSLEPLAPECRALAAAALAARYLLPRIARIASIRAEFGLRYWQVDTDRGPREFALKEPGKNVTWIGESVVVVRDTLGNRYEIHVDELDLASRRRLDAML